MKDFKKILFFSSLALNPLSGQAATGLIDLSLIASGKDNAKFGEYNALPESGGKLFGAFKITGDIPWSAGTGYWQMEGENIGLQTYDFAYTITEPARYKVKLAFDGSQQYSNLDSRTPFLSGQNRMLTLPDNWTAAATSNGMTAFDSTARSFDEEVHRDSISLEVSLILTENWLFDFNYQSQNRQGTQVTGGAIYFDASTAFSALLPVPIDEDNSSISTSLTFSNDRLTNTISYLASKFDDSQDQQTWSNPFLNPGNINIGYPNGLGSLSLSPDNDREEIRVTGSYLPIAISGLSVQWDTGWSKTRQDGSLLPYTVNPTLTINESPPIDSLNSSLDLFNGSLKLTYRPTVKVLRKLVLRGGYSVDDRDQDKTRAAFNYIRGDATNQPASIQGIFANSHDFRKEQTMVAGDYRLPWWRAKGTLEVERTRIERQNAAVSETETDAVRGILRFTPLAAIGVRIEATISDRSSGTYDWAQSFLINRTPAFIAQTPVDQRFDNHPLLSQFHLANAETEELKVNVNYTGIDHWSFAFDLQQLDTDYDQTVLGLGKVESHYYGFDIQYFASDHFTSYGTSSWSRYETSMAGRSFGGGIEKPANRVLTPLPQGSDPARNWATDIQDKVFTLSAGLLWQSLSNLSADANYTFVQTESGFIAETGGAVNLDASGLPDLETKMHSLNLSVTYQINEKTGMTFIYQYYDFEESDWATDNVTFDSVPNLVGVGESSLNGQVNLLGVSFQHRF